MGATGPPVRVGQEVEFAVTGLGHAGEGVGRYRDFALFVPGAMPGDTVRARITRVERRLGRAELVAVTAPAPERVTPPCPVYDACGGCQLQHISYPAQLRAKEQRVRDALSRIAGLADVPVQPIAGMADPWRYRNKAQFPVGAAPGGVAMGVFARGTHSIVDVTDCAIQHPTANTVLQAVRALVGSHGITPYDEAAHTGILRHVLVRVSGLDGAAMAVLVTNGPDLPAGRALAHNLMAAVPAVVSVYQNINPRRTNVVLGDESRLLAGQEAVLDSIAGLRFRISPRSFFQVNPVQVEVLYRQALAYARPAPDEVAIDAYCGIGTISLLLARSAARVHGIESVAEAVNDARVNATLNGIDNAEFHCGPAERLLPRLQEQGVRPDVIVFDPPRKGCDPAVLLAAAAMQPRRMVYVSCNPTTMARDLALLAGHGYGTVAVQPVDMFPHTAHVECCALVVRGESSP